jgi:hypothetical protein
MPVDVPKRQVTPVPRSEVRDTMPALPPEEMPEEMR